MKGKKKGTLAIIDADGFLFFAGWQYKEQLNRFGLIGAKNRVDKMLEKILDKIGATHYIGFFGNHGAENYRYGFATLRPYKGTRTSPPWQEYFKPTIKKHYVDKWGFHGMSRIEADDAVTIAFHQYKDDYNVIMVGGDKDMKQMGAFTRWNPDSKKMETFTHEYGRKFFWSQMLHGDQSDNIQGIEGIGAGKKGGETSKNKTVMELWDMEDPSEEEMFNFVQAAYIKKYPSNHLYHMLENYVLLYMQTEPGFDYPDDAKPTKWKASNNLAPRKLISKL